MDDVPIARRLQYSLATIRNLREQEALHQRILRQVQAECTHKYELHSQLPRPYDGNAWNITKWWVHLTCSICAEQNTYLEDAPVCVTCLKPLVRVTFSNSVTQRIEAELRMSRKEPVAIYIFACRQCAKEPVGFAIPIDEKKK